MELAVLNESRDPVVAANLPWIARAVNQQMADHFLPAYADFFKHLRMTAELWPVVAYASLDGISPADAVVCRILDKVPDGELGDHSSVLGLVSVRALAQGMDTASTLSHEAMEDRADRNCSTWIRQGDGSALAFEVGDPVEATDYPIEVDILGDRRTVRVSNFVLPAFWIPGSEGPWDYLGLLDGPGKPLRGCHMVRMELDGEITTETHRAPASAVAERSANPLARTRRRTVHTPAIIFDPDAAA